MAYASKVDFAETSGLGTRIVDENLGSLSAGADSMDLKNDNSVEGTLTLNYALADSNDFTALVETTHYTVDYESGRILYTPAGQAILTNDPYIVYATYWFVKDFNAAQIEDFLNRAHEEINKRLGKDYDTYVENKTQFEYFNPWRRLNYPHTDGPYDRAYVYNDRVTLKKHPVRSIRAMYKLVDPVELEYVKNVVLSSLSFTDITEEMSDLTKAPVDLFPTGVPGEALYIGAENIFLGLNFTLAAAGAVPANDTASVEWEYWNGTSWTPLNYQTDTDNVDTFQAEGTLRWEYPYGWEKVVADGSNAYWVRARITSSGGFTGYANAPRGAMVLTHDRVQELIQTYRYNWETNGTIYLTDTNLLTGYQNLRVDYNLGANSVPTYINELEVLIAALNCFITLSGGSYDDIINYRLGTKEVAVGEVYVNIREVITQYRKRIDEIMNFVGRKFDISLI